MSESSSPKRVREEKKKAEEEEDAEEEEEEEEEEAKGPNRPLPEKVEGELRTVQSARNIKTLREHDRASCIELLLDQTPAASVVVNFLERKGIALLRGQPASGKTWLIPAVVDMAKSRGDLWSEVKVINPRNFLKYMGKRSPSSRPRPLVIVDEAHLAWTGDYDVYIKNKPYVDFLFVTTASSVVAELRTVTPEELVRNQLWLSAVSTDSATVKKWIELLISRSTTHRTEDARKRLVEHTFAICGGHVGRVVAFLDAVLDKDGIQVPLEVFDGERSVTGGNGVSVFEHPLAIEIFSRGTATIDLHKLRNSREERDSRLLERIRNGYFVPVESWKVSGAIVEISDKGQWSLGSAAQRDFVTRVLEERTTVKNPLESSEPLDILIHTLPYWRTDLLFVHDAEIKKTPFLEKHVHQGFIDAFARLCCSCPSIRPRLVYEQPVPSENAGHPKSLDFVVRVDSTGERFGIEFLIDDSFEAHRGRFAEGGDYAPLGLHSHLTVYFEADSTRTRAALAFVELTPNTCVVYPCPVRGWDAFHVVYHSEGRRKAVLVPRVGGASRMFEKEPFLPA